MIEFPPIPSWDALHPLVVHFPIALLLVAPLFVLIGMLVRPERGRLFLIAALILMACGTVATFVAVASGEAAGKLAERNAAVDAVLEHHEELAETSRAVFAALTLAFAAVLFGPRLLRRELGRGVALGMLSAFLVAYVAGAVLLANTAHNGGRLVHELGVTAGIAPGQPLPAVAARDGDRGGDRDD